MKKLRKRLFALTFAVLYILMIVMIAFCGLSAPSNGLSETPESPSEETAEYKDVGHYMPSAAPVELTEEMALASEETIELTDSAVSLSYNYFDVPLDEDLQHYIFLLCQEYDIEPAVIVAMIYKESTYRAGCIGDDGKSLGLMQIQQRWHRERMRDLGVSDLLDPYQNVSVGIDYFCELYMRGKGLEWTLMAYNGGPSYANGMAAKGRVSSYAKTVMAKSHELGWRVW